MTPEKTKQAFDAIGLIVCELDCIINGELIGKRLSPEDAAKRVNDISPPRVLEHLYFMVEEGKRLIDQGRIEKAMRWLGFLQGALWGLDITSIEEQKSINKPDDEKYDAKKI